MFCVVTVVLAVVAVFVDETNAATGKMCYDAKTCYHNGVEKCGVDSKGSPRRFLDSCDIFEYNCLQKTDYVKANPKQCADLPALEK